MRTTFFEVGAIIDDRGGNKRRLLEAISQVLKPIES
jgi:hypothetical protein